MKLPDYDPTLLQLPLGDAELDQLDALLAELPGEAVMDVEALDGYLTGLLASPRLPPTEAWAPLVWGSEAGAPPPFASGKQTKRCVQLMLRHLAGLDRALRGDFPAFQPWFGIAEGADGEEAVDAQLWCSGFLTALELTAADWDGHWDLPEVALALRPITLLGGAELEPADAALVETVAQRDEWSRQVPEAVEALVLHWHPERRADPADEDEGPGEGR